MESSNPRKLLLVVGTAWLITIVIVASLTMVFPIDSDESDYSYSSTGRLERFQSISHMIDYLQTHYPEAHITYGPSFSTGTDFYDMLDMIAAGESSDYPEHSTTNVQVENVDEPDSVKTDGQYIYTTSYDEIVIIRAYPTDSVQVINRIQPGGYPYAIFLYESSRLIVLTSKANGFEAFEVYDVTNLENIVLHQNVTIKGEYVGARLIGKHLYYTAYSTAIDNEDNLVLPSARINGRLFVVPPYDIYFDSGIQERKFYYNMVFGLDITNPFAHPEVETIMVGDRSTDLYTSLTNMYLAMGQYPSPFNWYRSRCTVIHRFAISNGHIKYEASGSVPGYTINQFAFDQYEDTLRVATTSWANTTDTDSYSGWEWVQVNNVYVLDMSMNTIGALEGLAPREWIYSVRFLGNTGYLVTFNKVDPLFVIDLSMPTAPRLLGELEIPGYSDYLHPLGTNQVLGIGKNVTISDGGNFWWYQGVKLSLFNTTDPTNPQETLRMVIGVRGTHAPVLRDHHAILVDTNRNLLVLPILICEHTDSSYDPYPSDSGDIVWQGAMVFYLDASTATLTNIANITHIESSADLHYWFWGAHVTSPRYIYRSLYIGNVLYTLSPTKLAMHDLATFSPSDTLTFSTPPPD